ncbi:MAG: hypothetical protein A2W91_14485 [Bacteroidetes bacterium GWF2_38_335]|nr:MAG: hypothetical protein A2W91_14485 [Bacteroidetes bacterium GWF2_38_335]OFY79333.1 MAG: hypothetical protein A2281_16670 [Bacteroidetes bacterium RIFOXYA12_FULL_38_20]
MSEEKVHIIAEAGTNHNGNFSTAKKLVDIAVKAKADSVKFQIIYPEGLYLPGVYEFGHYDILKVVEMRRRFMLTDKNYLQLDEYCRKKKIAFSASVFDKRGADLLAGMNPPFIKIASTDLNNFRLLRIVAEKGIKMILSTGMSTLSQVEKSVNELYKSGFDKIVLMHCVSAYPARLEEMNLGFIDALRTSFGFPVGLSDHTQGSIAACMALTKKISYIEKHYTIDHTQEGFDHLYAFEEDQFIEYVDNIRKAEEALSFQGSKLKKDELYVKKRARRSLYAARAMKKGEVIKDKDVMVVRPEGIMDASEIDLIIGKKLNRNIKLYEPFSPDMIS